MRNTRRTAILFVAMAAVVAVASSVALAAVIEGGPGDNTIRGTELVDTLGGNDGSDTIYGMADSDEVDGGNHRDFLYGGNEGRTLEGDDRVLGRGGDDRVVGGPGADFLHGGGGDDALFAGPDEDAAVDNLQGYDGNDRLFTVDGSGAADIVACGVGRDEVSADPTDQVDADCEIVNIVRDVVVDFAGDKSVGQALQIAETFDATTEELSATYVSGDDFFNFSYTAGEADPTPTAAEVTETMISAFEEDRQHLRESAAEETATPDASSENPDPAADVMPAPDYQTEINRLGTVLGTVESNGAEIDEISVQTEAPVGQIEQDPAVEAAADVSPEAVPEETADPDAAVNRIWAPKSGRISTGCCAGTYNRRFVYQEFVWNDWSINNLRNVDGDANNITWEQEAAYNTNNGTYLSRITTYASSNMPYWYKDLDRCLAPPQTGRCPTALWTVGSYRADVLKANKPYYTTIRTTNGSQDSGDGAGVSAQVGKRAIPHCRNPICVGKRQTVVLLYQDSYRAPGKARWTSYN